MDTLTEERSELSSFVKILGSRFPEASASLKTDRADLFGETCPALTFVQAGGESTLWLPPLKKALQSGALTGEQASYWLASSRVDADQPQPALDAFLHAAVPAPVVILLASEPVLALASARSDLLAENFSGQLIVAPFGVEPLAQAKSVVGAWEEDLWGIVLPHRGLMIAGATLAEAVDRLQAVEAKAKSVLEAQNAWSTEPVFEPQPVADLRTAAELRKQVSQPAGVPLVIRWAGRANASGAQRLLVDAAPYLQDQRIVTDESLGTGFAGRDAGETAKALAGFELEQKTAQRSAKLGEVDWLAESPAGLPEGEDKLFRGEVALVTGAASGIGKACVTSFLERGAAVVGLDVNPAVVTLYDRPDYLGIACDLTNEDAIREALKQAVLTFGGVDMMVLNAGIFPSGKRIESLSNAEWDKVLRINLDANLTLMREAHPLLKNAPKGGRVVANASRNALAPGPGAAAYSVSKMALTQLVRVAALEWGDDGIRINAIHPDSVFDTGVWTEEVLQARAAHYHMTIEQYKRRNILKTELTSRDISEVIAEMCGPLFAKVTGAQIPVDGGNDRVI